ncbi:MAG: energy transducer TonB [Pseudomonadota bacterium]
MTTGAYISGAGHLFMMLWVLLGGVIFRAPPPNVVSTAEVSLISPEAYAELAALPEPESTQDIATPSAPDLSDSPTVPDAALSPQSPAPRPEIAEPADAEDVPEPPELDVPAAEVDDVAPSPPAAPDTSDQVALLAPVAQPEAPRSAPRVAPVPAPAPPPLAEEAPELSPGVTETPEAREEEPVVEEQPAAAPPEATTEIVTEAEDEGQAFAPRTSIRPRQRPPRQVLEATRTPTDPEPEASDNLSAAIAGALAEAATTPEPTAPSRPLGPPLTQGEKDTLRVAVQRCWNVGSLSTEALRTTVVVAVSMLPDGKPDNGTIRMLSSDGSQAATSQAFEAARRAVIRCGLNGYDLPADKYEQWRDIEMTFNPENMRIK